MKFEIVHTDHFARQLKKLVKRHRSLKNDLESLVDLLETDPEQGQAIGSGCYKVRLAISSKGKGKSGGARVITHVFVQGKKVFLLSIFDKADHENISDKDLQVILKMLGKS